MDGRKGGSKEVIVPLFIASGQITCKMLCSIPGTSKDVNKLKGFQMRGREMMKGLQELISGERLRELNMYTEGLNVAG